MKDANYSFEHTKERTLERYGFVLSKSVYDAWCRRCTPETEISRQVDKKIIQTVHVIDWLGRPVRCVFENKRNCVTTVLPLEGTKYL